MSDTSATTGLRTQIAAAVEAARAKTPMTPSITNTVTINFVANAQLAVGGSAAMVYLPDEGEVMAQAGAAIYVNVGTLMPVYAELLPRTVRALRDHGTPWVLDPVAIGVGGLRTELLRQFREFRPTVIRGNASEIIALAALWGLSTRGSERVRGVDSIDTVDAARDAAVALARWTRGAVAVSGVVDLVTDGALVAHSSGGSPLMTRITGAGCSLGGVAAVYAAVSSPFTAALTATAIYNLAGARAGQTVDAPASFQVAFLDELYRADAAGVAANPLEVEEA
jgi:hydroxyethylthiazole kinase